MNILGLSLGILSTAAVFKDSKLSSCISQERFSRKKNDEAFPLDAINFVMQESNLRGKDLDAVVISGNMLNLSTHLMRKYSNWTLNDHFDIMNLYWKPKLIKGKDVSFNKIFKHKIDIDQYPGKLKWNKLLEKVTDNYSDSNNEAIYKDFLHLIISELLDIDKSKIIHIDHHECHAAYAYWATPIRGEDTLVLTADAFGDGLSSTISTVNSNGNIVRKHSVNANDFQLGRIYRSMTLLLAMMPDAHEFKVMGLAPYAKNRAVNTSYEIFKEGMYVDGIDFKYHEKPSDLFFYYKDKLQACRFDGIAGGLQKYTEEIMVEYISNALKFFKVNKLVYSGGISMNVKANMLIKDISQLKDMSVAPSGGDESLAIGACYAYMDKMNSIKKIMPIENTYLGSDIFDEEIKDCMLEAKRDNYFTYTHTPKQLASYLADGKVVGRCVGKAEFGARSLGNRAIIADPRNKKTVEIINEKIKNRDFWMPFAPSILAEECHKYIINDKNLFSPYMTIGFESTDEGENSFQAAIHPSDKTLRPQMVTKDMNPKYHELISEFYTITGVGGLMNTSFNLHGFPIVNKPADAYEVFKKSGIDILAFDEHLISKEVLD